MSVNKKKSLLREDQFKDYIQVYRGLDSVKPHEVDTKNLGMHWSENYKVAEDFAYPILEPGRHGTIVGALVHPKHIEKNKKVLDLGDVDYDLNSESEVPVKKGRPVHITGMTHLTWDDEQFHNINKKGKA